MNPRMDALDFSSWTKVPTPAQVECWRANGVRRAIIGTRGNVAKFPGQARVCIDGGLEVEAYVFLYAHQGGREQAEGALKLIRPFPDIRFIWPDAESDHNRTEQLPAPVWRRCLDGAFGVFDPYLGREAGIYTSISQWGALLDNTTIYRHRPLWDARYWTGKPIDLRTPIKPFLPYGGWKAPTITQYAGTVEVCGLNVDANIIEGAPQQEGDMIRLNGIADHWEGDPPGTGIELSPGDYQVNLDVDFPFLPSNASAVRLEFFLAPGAGTLVVRDGMGNYAGRAGPQPAYGVVDAFIGGIPEFAGARGVRLRVEDAPVTVKRLGILGYYP